MNKAQIIKRKIPVSLGCLATLFFVGAASAALTITTDNQNSASSFTPNWTVATDSLIAGASPSSSSGNLTLEAAGGSSKLTDGAIGPVGSGTGPFATCGNSGGAGATLVYTLPASAHGYNLTNVTVYSGWGDNGRDAQAYNVSYSTVANPTSFISLGYVNYNPSVGGGRPSANRVMLTDSLGAPIAANVAAIKFDFTAPTVENGYAGYAEITVQGTAAATVTALPIAISTSDQTPGAGNSPTFTIETDSLIAGQVPSTVGGGNFQQEFATGTPALTDGTFGTVDSAATYATGGASGGNSLIYTLTNSANGSDLTNIVVYSGWGNRNRDGQFYNVLYSTVSAPTTFIPLTSIFYNPPLADGTAPFAHRLAISTSTGAPLAQNVGALKFDFTPQAGSVDNGYSGYAEIIVEGINSAPPTAPPAPYLLTDAQPASAANMVGEQVIFTAAFSNSPAATFQWQKVVGAVTNDIPGATTTTLTLNNLQVADSGSYQLKAINATNNLGVSYSAARPLTVSSVPAPVNGVITKLAAQTGLGFGEFIPTWTVSTNNSLIAGQLPSSVGLGNFSMELDTRVVDSLTAGGNGSLSLMPGTTAPFTTTPNYVSCGINPAGQSITYTLPASATGYDLTNIMVFGGWADGGRNEQKYTVYYSTVAAPTSFNALATVDYNPADPANAQSATRVTLVPSGTAVAQNVAAVMFDFNMVGAPPKNNWEGYSQILLFGVPSAPKPILVQDVSPLNASDVVGSQLTMTATFNGATSYQWQKDGANIAGATLSTLTLNNLQLSSTATNGGYRLVASNVSGSSSSRACALTVIPVPAADANNVVLDVATQTSDAQAFGPTWTVASGSLIANAAPSDMGTGNFNDPDVNPASYYLAGGTPALTDGTYGSIDNSGAHPSFATCGPNAGQYVTYTFDTSVFTNGYTLTNITVGAGWNDGGRDQQAYTVYYATVANPLFVPLTSVNYNPANPGNTKSYSRVTLVSPTGLLASNVTAVLIDFTSPVGENAYSGYDEIAVYGVPSGAVPANAIATTTENQNTDTPTWTVETDSLIENQLPSSVGPGSFAGNFNNEPFTGGLPVLTDGTFGPFGLGNTNFATCGGGFGAGSSIIYGAATGWNLNKIVVYSGWGNFDRDGQFYDVSYSTLSAPGTFIPLVTVDYNPPNLGGPSVNRVAIARLDNSPLATQVAAVKFDFTRQNGSLDNGYSGYAEIVLQGVNLSAPTSPTVHSPYVANGNLILTGTGGTPNRPYTWLSTTNLSAPVVWTTNSTGVLSGTGSFSNAVPINAAQPASFFQLRMP
ncbi:beta strand repeat-containing protein [Pedosphaera parvula]|uniref:Immunoglobulin subtype n=1 Tax=Pedosphaera parvula (strain Ellin514) TaxID=320771 RepID=B9XF86_PEDPL|nr:Immunoglobulin subtype [Pedosphaera parvula]EEF61584.1 Immunoglobulin subtype [Pedosphaera parvula Ellin514]